MPFSLGQIFGGWRRKDNKARKGAQRDARPPRPGKTLGVFGDSTPSVEEGHGGVKEISDSAAVGATTKSKSETAWNVIRSPHISEKATMLGEGRYVLKVADDANKPDIKQAIEERYGVSVDLVRVINVPAKARRRGRFIGEKAGFKKAIIKLKDSNLINEF